ncbi:class I adenylate-forming enzyme family protein [Nocardioides sediminis]|uniref:class I adenylate-forming enzyme family protein n=1 Tax=Nocardioides sediminis TaxID=433648 RepID=UPI000D30278E|nr:AMP-binding protein [Nocardioides sediminis]
MSRPRTLHEWLAGSARQHPTKVAIDDRGVPVTYAELDRRSDELARGLTQAGYAVGDRVVTLTGNSAEHVVLFLACARTGLVLVPMSWRLTPSELGPMMATTRPSLVVAEDELQRLARASLDRAGLAVPMTAPGSTGVESTVPVRTPGPERGPEPRGPVDDDPLLVVFTSGSEASPKGVVLSHANVASNSLAMAEATGLTHCDVVLATLPQFHVAAWNCQPLAAWWHGATVVLERSFEPARVLRLVADRGVTTMMCVPTQLHLLAADPTFPRADLVSLRHAVVGGASMPESLRRVWAQHGVQVGQGYGLTEASANVLYLPPSEAADHPEAVGWPYPGVEVRLVGEDGPVEGVGQGELQVRGPGVFTGYLHDPERTAAALDGEWLRTGDLAARDQDGCHRIVDRLKHIYISGGENVAPAEVEAVLVSHPLVADAAVVAVPDEVWGEVGVAFVQPVPGARLTVEDVLAHAREHLAGFKAPREVHVLEDLPRTGIGKIARADLRRRVEVVPAVGRGAR